MKSTSISKAGSVIVASALFCLVTVFSAHAQSFTINAGDAPVVQTFNDTEAGWDVTPTSSLDVTNIVSDFNYDLFGQGNITCSIYQGGPSYLGGVLLASGSSIKNDDAGDLTFTMSSPVNLTAGDTYLIDFTGIYGLGVNVTDDPNAVMPGTEFYTLNGQNYTDNSDFYDQPILSINGTPATTVVPEPSSGVSMGIFLASTAIMLLVGAYKRKQIGFKKA